MIHREGHSFLIVVYIIGIAISAAAYIYLPFWAFGLIALTCLFFAVFFTQFFRNPKRVCPNEEDILYSPADGKVVVIEKVLEKRFFNKEMLQVSVFMSPLNVHCNRVPFNGKVIKSQYHNGKYLVAFHPKSSDLNESTSVVFENKNGVQIVARQIAGAVARRIICYMKEGDTVKGGDELGFIKFGSRMDIFVPLGSEVLVKLGDKPVAGETPLIKLPKNN